MARRYGPTRGLTAARHFHRAAQVSSGLPLLLLVMGLTLGGCARHVEAPPSSALKQARQDAKASPEELELRQRHVAPPPAYGNKVVLAEANQKQSAGF